MASVTVATNKLAIKGKATITSHVVVTPPAQSTYSFHDCTDPAQASIANCLWPVNMITGGLKEPPTPNGLSVTNGLVVASKGGGGSITVNY